MKTATVCAERPGLMRFGVFLLAVFSVQALADTKVLNRLAGRTRSSTRRMEPAGTSKRPFGRKEAVALGLRTISAEDARDKLQRYLKPCSGAVLATDEETNTLFVQATPTEVERSRIFLRKIDSAPARYLVIRPLSLVPAELAAQIVLPIVTAQHPGNAVADKRINAIILSGWAREMAQAATVLDVLE